jgi:hypothetical protein
MNQLSVRDLAHDLELDREAQHQLRGGFYGFLAGLQAIRPSGPGALPMNLSVTNNVFVDYTQNVFQQNPLNVNITAGEGGVVSMGDFSPMLLSAGSPMTLLQGGSGI